MHTPVNRPRILIADDHTLVAELCRKLLEVEYQVVGIVSNGRAMVRAAEELRPDVIVIDIAMPVLNGMDAGQQVTERFPAIKLIHLTVNPDPTHLSKALSRDTVNYLRKKDAKVVDEWLRLTERQREVLQLLAEGKAMKEVGSILNMTARTVAFHKYRIMDVLGARSNADLIRYAVRSHMVAA